MGVHICIYDESGNDVKEWDRLRQANDKQFPELTDGIPYEEVEHGIRLKEFEVLRNRIKSTDWNNKDRYLLLVDLLENNESYYLYFSW